jgi:hypothetical protein
LAADVFSGRVPALTSGAGALPRRDPLTLPDRTSIAALAALGSLVTYAAFARGVDYFSDDFGYHGLAVYRWLQQGHFFITSPIYTAYYPMNAELLSLWFCIPYGNDAWAGMAGWYCLLLLSFVLFQFASLAGTRLAAAAILPAIVIASPEVVWLSRTFCANDLAATTTCLAAVVCVLRSAKESGRAVYWCGLGGALGGFALGCKVSYLPALVLIGAATMLVIEDAPAAISWGKRAARLGVFLCGAILTGAYWYCYDWLLTGSPIYPAAAGPFPGPF